MTKVSILLVYEARRPHVTSFMRCQLGVTNTNLCHVNATVALCSRRVVWTPQSLQEEGEGEERERGGRDEVV